MTSPKELFSQNKELSGQVAAVAHTQWFSEWLLFAQAVMLDDRITTEELSGAIKFRDAMLSLAEAPEASKPPHTSGINYDLSIPVRTTYTNTQTIVKPVS